MMNKNKIVVLFLVVVLLGGYFVLPFLQPTRSASTQPTEPTFVQHGQLTFLKPDDSTFQKVIAIEVADTPAEQAQGLMYRTSMQEKQGMLFLFNREQPQGFWMKNTHISLDIIYVNSNREIVSIQKYTSPFSEESLPSAEPAQFVVEVIAGFTDKYQLAKGDRITWQLGM